MISLTENVKAKLIKIQSKNYDLLNMACVQRSKYEGWLKFELANALNSDSIFSSVVIEDAYPSNGRSDISFHFEREKWYVEMKTANTNFRAPGLENLIRPITKNIREIADDICVLQEKTSPSKGLAIFSIFPIPTTYWTTYRNNLKFHLQKIEKQANLPIDFLDSCGFFVQIKPAYGICNYLVEIVP